MKDFLGEEAIRSERGLEEEKITIRETDGQSTFGLTKVANDGSKSRVDQKEVYLSERKAAEDAIQRQDVPAGYREYVKRYFDGIQPAETEH